MLWEQERGDASLALAAVVARAERRKPLEVRSLLSDFLSSFSFPPFSLPLYYDGTELIRPFALTLRTNAGRADASLRRERDVFVWVEALALSLLCCISLHSRVDCSRFCECCAFHIWKHFQCASHTLLLPEGPQLVSSLSISALSLLYSLSLLLFRPALWLLLVSSPLRLVHVVAFLVMLGGSQLRAARTVPHIEVHLTET